MSCFVQSTMHQTLKLLRTDIYKNIRQKSFSISACLNKSENESNTLKTSAENESKLKLKESSKFDLEKRHERYIIAEKDKEIVNKLRKRDIFYPYKDPYDRITSILKKDIKLGYKKLINIATDIDMGNLEPEYFPRFSDILIVGSGAIGLLVAFHIRNKFPFGPNVIVVDRDSNFPQHSTNLAQSTLIQQLFTDEDELKMSMYCAEFLSSYHRITKIDGHEGFHLDFEPVGSLVLADQYNAENMLLKSEIMKKHGVPHNILNLDTLKFMFPWLNLEGVLFGSLGMSYEGLFDPWSFLIGLKYKAINLGVTFVTADVVDVVVNEGIPVRAICRLPDGTYNSIEFGYCVLATGMDTLNFCKLINETDISNLKLKLPIEERKRYEYCFYKPDGPGLNCPILIDSDGTYFRREGLAGYYIAGVPSVRNDEYEEDELYNVFQHKVKPFLKRRVPEFENVELVNAWVDTYDTNTGNNVGITGSHPDEARLVFASGFRNQGIQYAPAVGRAVMEFIIHSQYMTIDMKNFEIENLYRKQRMEAEERKRKQIASEYRLSLPQ